MEIVELLDVTTIEPRYKHPAIFERFDALKPESSFIIANDHDPKPLYYQLLAERGQTFTWIYLESGPTIWKVKITLLPDLRHNETIGHIVANDYRKAAVFKKMGINYVCEGGKTLKEVSEQMGLNLAEIEEDLKNNSDEAQLMDFQNWDVGFLCKYLIQLHHQYIKTQTPFIDELFPKAAKINGTKYPEINELVAVFLKAGKLLELNSLKEEQILFPYITALAEAHKKGKKIKAAEFGNISVPILLMEAEHQCACDYFNTIRQLTKHYTLPAYPSNSHGILFKMLNDYDDDLHFHLHLENNILFPKAIQLEADMRTKNLIQE
jgi:regulator of cell morphogenesis and NO signaling